MATVPMVGERRYVITDVSWEAYEALLTSWKGHAKRMTYDHGSLEFMSPQLSHEQYGVLLGRMIVFYAFARKVPIHTGRSLTLRRESMPRGLEPDDCYWVQNEPRMRSRKEFDPDEDPPPDVAIEVDVSASSLPRMSIYASLGVPEVWRYDGAFTINLLGEGGEYRQSEQGLALPGLTAEVVGRFLALSDQMGETQWLGAFCEWVSAEEQRETPKKPRRPRRK